MTRGALLGLLVLLLLVSGASGQSRRQLYTGPTSSEPRWATAADFDGSLVFCTGHYESTRTEASGSGWRTDYPGAGLNFLVRLDELTKVRVKWDADQLPVSVVVALDNPLLMRCPVLFMSDVGTLGLTTAEVVGLRLYLAKGGFLWVDDFWGTLAWEQWEREIRRVLPAHDYRMIDIPADHPIVHGLYETPLIPQIPNVGIWEARKSGTWADEFGGTVHAAQPSDRTSERYDESRDVHFRGLVDARDRIVVVMTHNTDIADGWEEEASTSPDFREVFSAKSYAIGVNIVLYALTH